MGVLPIYFWVLLLINGFLAAHQRQQDWETAGHGHVLFGDDTDTRAAQELGDPRDHVRYAVNLFERRAWEAESLVRPVVESLERLSNAMSFADGAASVVWFAGLGASALALSLSLFLAT